MCCKLFSCQNKILVFRLTHVIVCARRCRVQAAASTKHVQPSNIPRLVVNITQTQPDDFRSTLAPLSPRAPPNNMYLCHVCLYNTQTHVPLFFSKRLPFASLLLLLLVLLLSFDQRRESERTKFSNNSELRTHSSINIESAQLNKY